MMGTLGKNETERKTENVRGAGLAYCCTNLVGPVRPDCMDVSSKLAFRWEANRRFIHLVRGQHANMAIKQVFPLQQSYSITSFVVCQCDEYCKGTS